MASPVAFTSRAARIGLARRGTLTSTHGVIDTPQFMPVGTQATVKALTPGDLRTAGVQVILANTYHLSLRPGHERIARLGGLHRFMGWDGPILTDSGGFQVFSLAHLSRVDDDGVTFASHLDGSSQRLTPERAVEIQEALGSDIAMAFDQLVDATLPAADVAVAMRRTHRWAERCIAAHTRPDQALFGIVQGSTYRHLRESCAQAVVAMDLPGVAIGGVSVGEGHDLLVQVTGWTVPLLPPDKPRYLMGVGLPEDVLAAIGLGIDMFDCVIPTRYARSATVFTRRGRVRLTNRRYRRDGYPIDPTCDCATCAAGFTRAYLHHLFAANEILSAILASVHNVRFYQRLVGDARRAILEGGFKEFSEAFRADYRAAAGPSADGSGAATHR